MSELISILIPAYNCEKWIADTIKSAINQTWKNIEIIIVNDGSSDNTLEIIESFASNNIKIINQNNAGQCHARNVALSHAQGDYIQWLDGDDLLDPEKLFFQMKYADIISKETLLSSSCGHFYHNINKVKFIKNNLWNDLCPLDWLTTKLFNSGTDYIAVHAWLTSRKLIDMAGSWDTRLNKTDDDGEYYSRIVSCSRFVKFVSEAKCYYRKSIGNSNLSSKRNDFESELLLKNLIIDRMLSFENSQIVKKACEHYLQTWINNSYHIFPNVYSASSSISEKYNLDIKPAKIKVAYEIVRTILGTQKANMFKFAYGKIIKILTCIHEF